MNSETAFSELVEDGDVTVVEINAVFFIDNWDFVHHAKPDVCEDGISTVAFNNYDSAESGCQGTMTLNLNSLPSLSIASSHGTVEEFIQSFTCVICHNPPSSQIADIIWSNRTTFRECRMHINGDG